MRSPKLSVLARDWRLALRRLARSKLLWSCAMLVLAYALGGFVLAPYLVRHYLPQLAQDRLGHPASVGEVRINPFTLTVEASDFRLESGGDKPLIGFKRLFLDADLASIVREWTLAAIELDGAEIAIEIDRNGRVNLLDVLERLRKRSRPDEPPPRLLIKHLRVRESRVSLTDLSGATRASAVATPINVELFNLSTLADHEGRHTLAAKFPGGGTLTWKGRIALQPIAATGEFALNGMKLETAWRFLRDELNLGEPRGELSVAAHYRFGYDQGKASLDITGVNAALSGLALALNGEKRPLIVLRTVRVSDASFDLARHDVRVAKLLVSDGELNASTSEDGALDWQRIAAARTARKDARAQLEGAAAPTWRVRVRELAVEKVALEYSDHSRKPAVAVRSAALNGGLGLDITTGGASSRYIAADAQLALDRIVLAASGSAAPLATLESLNLAGGRVDTGERIVRAKTIALSGGGVKLARGRAGWTGLLEALLKRDARQATPVQTADQEGAGQPWRYGVDAVALKRFDVELADGAYQPEIAYRIEVGSLSGTHLDSASKKPIDFETALRIGKRATASARGTLEQDFSGARARVELAHLPLEPLRPLLSEHATLELVSGNASAAARVTWRRGAKPSLIARGKMSVEDFRVNEARSNERFAAWKELAAEGVALTVSPSKLAIKDVLLSQPGGKIVIAADRTVNVTRVLKATPAAGNARVPPKQPAATTTGADSGPAAFDYDIARIRLEGGTLDFADLSLVLPFATQVQALRGSIVGISSNPGARAELKLEGQVDRYGEARADGVLIPRDPKTYLDVRARFNNVEMPLLSPYSATFAGRKVAAGKLSLVLDYKVVNSKLAGENRIVLRDFRLGERVKAPNALDLPLDLAVALLKDSEGKISLAVPVRGDLGSPQFDYGAVIRGAIGNAITRVVTAPFRALASLFGKGASDEIRTVRFAAGSDRITPSQRERLDALAKALEQRPQLTLVVRGPYDTARDGRELRRSAARLELARALGAKLEPGEDPGPIAYGQADTQKALEALLAQRGGADAVRALEKSFAKRMGRPPERVNPVLGLFGRGSRDREFYEAVFDRVVELETLPEPALRTLAASRARAIVETLVKAGIDANRVKAGAIAQVKAAAGTRIATDLALEASAGS